MNEERQDSVTEPDDHARRDLPASRKRGTVTGPPPPRGGRRGRGTRPMDPSRPCMNCGDPTPGEYCPTCGQRKVDVQVSVRVLMMDVLEDQFILDRRLPRTLATLFLRPGRLTVDFVNGRIASYIHPFRLYLVTSLLFFLLLSFLSLQLVRRATVGGEGGGEATEAASPAADSARLAELDTELAHLDSVLTDSTLPAAAVSGLQLGRASVVRNRERVVARLDSTARAAAPATAAPQPPGPGEAEPAEGPEAAGADSLAGGGPSSPDGTGEAGTVAAMLGWESDAPNVTFPIPAVEAALKARVGRIGAMQPREALEELVETFVNYVPTLMFLLLPIFAVVLKLLYIRRGRYYAEHFVFLLHVHVFVFLLASLMLLLRAHVAAWLELAAFGWILVYIYIAMKRVYGQGWLKTLVKYWLLGWSYFTILLLSLPLAIIATFFLF